jgi:hypothetical protein
MGEGQLGSVGWHSGTGPPSEKLVFWAFTVGIGDGQFGSVGWHKGTGPPSENPTLEFLEVAIAETVPSSIRAARAEVAMDFMANNLLQVK